MDLDRNTHCMATHKSKTSMFSRILLSKNGCLVNILSEQLSG